MKRLVIFLVSLIALNRVTAQQPAICIQLLDYDSNLLEQARCVAPGLTYSLDGLSGEEASLNGLSITFPKTMNTEGGLSLLLGPTPLLLPEHEGFIRDGIVAGGFVLQHGREKVLSLLQDPVTVTVPYDGNAVEAAGHTHAGLRLYELNPVVGLTQENLAWSEVDSVDHVIRAGLWALSHLLVATDDCDCLPVETSLIPRSLALLPNYPNPFNPSTTIQFEVGTVTSEPVQVSIYNLIGQEIVRLYEGSAGPGLHSIEWDGRDGWGHQAATGVYLCRLTRGHDVLIRRMILAK